MTKKIRSILTLGIIGTMVLTGCSKPVEDTTAPTEEVKQEAVASTGESEEKKEEEVKEELRIVSGTVAATQALDALGAELVGIPTTKQTLPERYIGLPEVGMAMSPDLEVVVSLEPDLFVLDSNFKENIEETLTSYDVNTFFFNTGSYTTFLESIDSLGDAIGKEKEAGAVIEELKDIETDISKKAANQEAPRIAIVFGANDNFQLATSTSYVGDLAKAVGAVNISDELAGGMEASYIQLSLEQIIEQNPDYVLRFAHGNIEETKKSFDEAFNKNPGWATLDAVEEGKVIDLDSSIFGVSANMRVKEAITILGNLFYGE